MDLKKLFVYVPAAAEATFTASVINVPAEAAKYANKIVFLESSHRIWVKEKFYGTNPSDMQAIWTALGIEAGTTPSGSYTVGEQTFSYADFSQWIGALKSYADAKIAAEKTAVVTAYEAADAAIISGYQGADAAIISSYEAADAALNNAYTAFKNKVGAIDSLTGTLKEYIDAQDASARTEVAVSGSGISVQKTAGADGHDIYTVIADQSIWEFMGSATAASVAAIPATLDGKYAEEGAKRDHAEVGDVWAVTVGSNTTLYACSKLKSDAEEYNTWTLIGSAQGISGVDTTPSHGVNLTNTASVVGVTVTPGSVAENNDSVVTGGAVFTAISEEHDLAYAKIAAEKAEIVAAYEAADAAIIGAYEAADAAIIGAYEAADAAIISGYQGADSALQDAIDDVITAYQNADSDIISAYEAADAALNTRINNLDATYTGGEQVGGNNLFTYNLTQVDGQVTAAEVTFDKTVMHNYVADNLWETYSAS